ncbi:hypothetical protein A3J41_02000 [candidate division TM6 bacterium RIFCSPHIGHO2_12_FULL_38_8]|nr:MAG: hypothetical protein A3J41_02000 [candidate division TM6 bacterium RIFCSPHIGHO2_12_FULL_38_8]
MNQKYLISIFAFAALTVTTTNAASRFNPHAPEFVPRYASVNINAPDAQGEYPLITAVDQAIKQGNFTLLNKLLDTPDINVNVMDQSKTTPLMYAAYKNQKVTDKLIEKGADLNLQNHSGLTALMFAVMGNEKASMRSLLKAGADTNAQDIEAKTALIWAIDLNNTGVVDILLEHDATVNPLEHYATVNLQNRFGFTPLLWAVAYKNQLQQQQTITPHTRDSCDLLQARRDHIITSLLRHHADPNIPDHRGNTALMWAIYNFPDKYNANDNWMTQIQFGRTIFNEHLAEEAIRRLVDKNANLNMANKSGLTPLAEALKRLSIPAINKLLHYSTEKFHISDMDYYAQALKIVNIQITRIETNLLTLTIPETIDHQRRLLEKLQTIKTRLDNEIKIINKLNAENLQLFQKLTQERLAREADIQAKLNTGKLGQPDKAPNRFFKVARGAKTGRELFREDPTAKSQSSLSSIMFQQEVGKFLSHPEPKAN